MEINPKPGQALIEPHLHSQEHADTIQKRSGLLIPPPDNKHSFEGIPSMGTIYKLPTEYDGELQVGMMVTFKEDSPKGFKFEDRPLFAIPIDNISGIINKEDV